MYINPDGSGMLGGKLPSAVSPNTTPGQGQALALDSLGGLIVSRGSLGSISNAQGFYGTTGQMTSASGTVDAPMSMFNPSNSGKNILITSIIVGSGTGALAGILFATTVDPAYGSALKINNAKAGGAASVISGTFVNTTQSEPGSGEFRRLYNTNSQELIPDGFGISLPNGSANGVTTFLETYSAGIGSQSITWIEF